MRKTETKSTVLLKHHLKALKLPTMTAECEKVARRCAAEDVDHLGFLLQLCELELIERERRAATRRLKAARFPTVKTLESFDFAAAPAVNKPMILELARCEYIDRRENVLLIGASGTGKTHLATALAPISSTSSRRSMYSHRISSGISGRFTDGAAVKSNVSSALGVGSFAAFSRRAAARRSRSSNSSSHSCSRKPR